MWVAVGIGINQIAYSFDGITWIGLGSNYWDYWGVGVEWNGSMWIAGGYARSVIYYSYDGVVWRAPITNISSSLSIESTMKILYNPLKSLRNKSS